MNSVVSVSWNLNMNFLNLEHGFIGQQSFSVNERFRHQVSALNDSTSQYLRHEFARDRAQIMADLARFCAVDPGEILLTRSCSEALQILLHGYPLATGDQVICSLQDYDTVHFTLRKLVETKQITLNLLAIPFTEMSESDYVEAYEKAISADTKLIVLSHVCHRHGLILPVKQITEMAQQYGVDVLVDAAHSFALLNSRFRGFGADFVAVNLHKWFGAPAGTGLLYIKNTRIRDIKSTLHSSDFAENNILKLAPLGMSAAFSILNIADALAENIASSGKAVQLSKLTAYWMERLAKVAGVQMVTPSTSRNFCAIGAFYVQGIAAAFIVEKLWQDFQILVVARRLYDLDIIRVTVCTRTTIADLDYFLAALSTIIAPANCPELTVLPKLCG